MTDDLIETLQRQLDFLQTQEGEWFAARLATYVDILEREPRTSAVIHDLVEETRDALRAFEQADNRGVSELVRLRDDLLQIAPRLDDSGRQPKLDEPDVEYENSLANFNRYVEKGPRPSLPVASDVPTDGSRTRALLAIIGAKLGAVARDVAGREGLMVRHGNIRQRHEKAWRTYALAMRTSAGLSALKLRAARHVLNPDPIEVEEGLPSRKMVIETELTRAMVLMHPLTSALFGTRHNDHVDQHVLEESVNVLISAARHLHEELLLRLRAARSRRTLVERFKLRCESYDRDRLRALADGQPNPENLLVGELARYLFDAGLDPLVGPLSGGLRPDVFDPRQSFYLEAKQYPTRKAAREVVRAGIKQVWNTAAVLKSAGVREVFFMVFRRSGPDLFLPPSVRQDSLTVYPFVVSIASIKESGQGTKEKPVAFTEEALSPAALDAPDLDADKDDPS